MSIASMTPAQQREYRIIENTYAGAKTTIPGQVYDLLNCLEKLVLLENASNIDDAAKKRINQLREAIKIKIANRR